MRLSNARKKSLYCLCQDCSAKWFCRKLPRCCPRCGNEDFLVTRAKQPWETERSEKKRDAKQPATSATTKMQQRASGALPRPEFQP